MKRYRLVLGIAVFGFAAILIGQAAPNGCITPGQIYPQGDGSTLDADMVDGKHASEIGAKSLWLIDADGKEVGLVVHHGLGAESVNRGQAYLVYSQQFQMFLDIVAYDATEDTRFPRYFTIGTSNFVYEGDDCTGQAYMDRPYSPYEQLFYTGLLSNKYYIPTGVVEDLEYHSRGDLTENCYPVVGSLHFATLVEEYTGELPSFTPPYHVELR